MRIPPPVQQVRCAIYTRKSTNEGLDSDFNTLDAQREACEAYILSQRAEGWVAVNDHYDDGGFTGGNTERPALRRLMQDIESGLIDCVMVYKVDRLSRSLLDFARLMAVFEQHQVSFVSVTQQFNTGSSMGRLVLNVLLSFAQFEREMIGERTRDKMCAARRRGKWMGGPPVLGYDIDRQNKRLVLHPDEAEMVRELFDLYLEKRSLLAVVREVNNRGWTTKSWVRRDGIRREGGRFDKAKLQRILTNVTYTGQVAHNGDVLPGEHPKIISKATFRRVQALIKQNSNGSGKEVRNKHGALLKGLLRCGSCGVAMAHTYTKSGNRLYRYYVCTTAQKQGRDVCSTPSLPAQEIEDFVVEQIKKIGRDPELARQVFAEAAKQQRIQARRLKAERKRLQRQRQSRGEEIGRLVGAIASSEQPLVSLTERLAEMESMAGSIDQRLTVIGSQLEAFKAAVIDPENVAAALAEFEPVWEVLQPPERMRLIGSLIDRVEYLAEEQRIRLQTAAGGFGEVLRDLGQRGLPYRLPDLASSRPPA